MGSPYSIEVASAASSPLATTVSIPSSVVAGSFLEGTIETFDEYGNPTFFSTDEITFKLAQQPEDERGSAKPRDDMGDVGLYKFKTSEISNAGGSSLELTLNGEESEIVRVAKNNPVVPTD